jgi:hypothetical protein
MYITGWFKPILPLFLNGLLAFKLLNAHARRIPAAARSMADRLLGLWVRIPPAVRMPVTCECCQLEISASGWSLVQRNPTECRVSECDREAPMRRTWPKRGLLGHKKIHIVDFTSPLSNVLSQVRPMVGMIVNLKVLILHRQAHALLIQIFTYRHRQIWRQRALLL